jgi:hypothetical protein
MRPNILFIYFIAAAILWSSCTKDDQQITPGTNPPPASNDFHLTTTLIAGSETEYGSATDNSPLDARFFAITKIVLDTRENKNVLYVLDQSDADLRIIDGNHVTTVHDIAGIFALAQSICLAPGKAGLLYITSGYGQLLLFDANQEYERDINPKVIIDRDAINGTQTGLGGTRGLAVDDNGDIYLGNSYINAVTKYDVNSQQISPFAGVPLADMADETPPFADGNAITEAVFGDVRDIALGKDGKLYVADRSYRTIREISNGNVKALFNPSPYPYENYIQPSVDGALSEARSAMINYIAIPAQNKNRVFFCTDGMLRVLLLDEKRVISLKQFQHTISGLATAPDGKTLYVVSGYGIIKVQLDK